VEWAGGPSPLTCGQLTRCFSAVAELLVCFVMQNRGAKPKSGVLHPLLQRRTATAPVLQLPLATVPSRWLLACCILFGMERVCPNQYEHRHHWQFSAAD